MKNMFHGFLDADGPLFRFLDMFGQLICLSVLWFLGCLPVLTVFTSNAALYYAVNKSLRGGQGSAVREFFRAYRANLGRGICITLLLALSGAVIGAAFVYFGAQFAVVLLILLAFIGVYAGPVISRFDLPVKKILELSFVMSLQYAHITFVLLLGSVLLIGAQLFILPMPVLVILPGVWCWLSSPLMERVLKKYMPVDSDSQSEWYYEN